MLLFAGPWFKAGYADRPAPKGRADGIDSLALFMNDELIDAIASEIILPKQ